MIIVLLSYLRVNRELFRVLHLMKMDMANFTIQQIRPFIKEKSVEFERKKFEDFLKTQEGKMSLKDHFKFPV